MVVPSEALEWIKYPKSRFENRQKSRWSDSICGSEFQTDGAENQRARLEYIDSGFSIDVIYLAFKAAVIRLCTHALRFKGHFSRWTWVSQLPP